MINIRQRRLRGAANRGQAESTRIRLLKQCVERVNVEREASSQTCQTCQTCPKIPAPLVQEPTAPDQLSYILDVAVRCPVLYVTPVTTYGCQPVLTSPIPPLQTGDIIIDGKVAFVDPPQGPAVSNVYRKFPRIRGIDVISKPLIGRSSSDRTARLQAGLVSASQTQFVQTVIPIVAYPPCLPTPPQPGVPVAPITPCNPGTRRVDYSNPTAA